MATQTEIAIRIDQFLRAVGAEVEYLPEVERVWPEWSDAERASFALSWDHLMADYVAELNEHFHSGGMTSQQQESYCKLLRTLSTARPLLDRFDLARPDAHR